MGRGGNEALGYEDTENRGDEPDEMGDNLPVVNLGTGFVVEDFITRGSGSCALSTSGQVKCWGYSASGMGGVVMETPPIVVVLLALWAMLSRLSSSDRVSAKMDG